MTMLEARRPLRDPAIEVEPAWIDVCAADDLVAGRGVCALVGGEQVAIFMLSNGALHAIDNRDPFSGAHVLSRGLTGTSGDAPTVASPVYKQRFDLRSGVCIDEPTVSVRTFGVRCVDRRILLRRHA